MSTDRVLGCRNVLLTLPPLPVAVVWMECLRLFFVLPTVTTRQTCTDLNTGVRERQRFFWALRAWGTRAWPLAPTTDDINRRAQIDLIDWHSEKSGDFAYILNYQDHLTKFVTLRALKTKKADEVAHHLLDIFCTFGAPNILQVYELLFGQRLRWCVTFSCDYVIVNSLTNSIWSAMKRFVVYFKTWLPMHEVV